ncbi:hypothetical protein ACS0TY_020021 [Phlomoides rotata]
MVMDGKRRMVHYDETSEIKKGPWKAEEDEVLVNHVRKYGPRDWSSIRSKGLLQRTGKSCRLRWVNKLRPNLKNGVKFSAEEERTVIDLQAQFGNKWAKIATYLSGRTDNDVKNFWSSRQKRLARILQTPSTKSQKNSKEVKLPPIHHVPLEVPNFASSSTEDETVRKTKSCSSSSHIRMGLAEIMHTNMLDYVNNPFQFNNAPQEKPFIHPNSHLPFPSTPQDFPLQLQSQEFMHRLGDSNFLDVFGSSCESSGIGTAALPVETSCFGANTMSQSVVKEEADDSVIPDIFMDDFPPIDMFDLIEPLPSPSDWSSMD